MSKLNAVAVMLSVGALCLVPGEVQAGVLPGIAGFAESTDDGHDSAPCFHVDWQDPGKIHYDGCYGMWANWNIPMPNIAPGNKNLSVFLKVSVQGVNMSCSAFVLASNGTVVRWDPNRSVGQHFEGWLNFATLAVNEGESSMISCNATNDYYYSDEESNDYISMVKGF